MRLAPAFPDHVRNQRGFTIIELIVVIILVGILSAVAAQRYFDRSGFDARGFYDQAQAMLRYGQKVAIAQNRAVYVRLNGASIALCFSPDCTVQVPAPSGNNSGTALTIAQCGSATWFCEAVPTGIAYTASPAAYQAANPIFFFSALGKPFNTGDIIPNSNFIRPLIISITGDGTTRTFSIERETGYVHS